MARKKMDTIIGEIRKKTEDKEVIELLTQLSDVFGESLNRLKDEIELQATVQAEEVNGKPMISVEALKLIMLTVGGDL